MKTISTTDLVQTTKQPSRLRLVLTILLIIVAILALVFIILYAVEKQKSSSEEAKNECSSNNCISNAAGIIENLDRSIDPCDDFYQYSCGGFLSKNYIREDQDKLDAFSLLFEKIQYQMKALLDKENVTDYKKGSAMHKTLTYYLSCMNESQVNSVGIARILDLISETGSAPILNKNWDVSSWSLEKSLAKSLVDSGVGTLIAADILPSFFNTSQTAITITSGKTGIAYHLEEKLKNSASSNPAKIIAAYKTYMKTVLVLLGANEITIDKDVDDIFTLEIQFISHRLMFNEQGVLQGYGNVMKFMTMAQLNNLTGGKFNWALYLNEVFKVGNQVIQPDEQLLVLLPENLKLLSSIIQQQTPSTIANTIIWNVINNFIQTLPIAFQEANAKFLDAASGVKTVFARWKKCFTIVNNHFPYTNALMYSQEYFSEEARIRAINLFSEVKNEFIDGLEEQKWMDDESRKAARLKLDMMKNSVGYPLIIKNATALNMYYDEIDIVENKFFENFINLIRTMVKQKMRQLHKEPVVPPFPGSPVAVNAYYHPAENAIAVLAGILQPPYYESNRPKALNYGGIGMVIGHEITHGFDVSGSQFDETGSVRSWLTKESLKNFKERSSCIAKQYNQTFISGRKVDGKLTLSENIADNGGLKYAFRAYKKWQKNNGDERRLPGLDFTDDQLFFIGFGQVWCTMFTEAALDKTVTSDTHAPGPVRVRIPVKNFPEFSKAFNCPKQENTCAVW